MADGERSVGGTANREGAVEAAATALWERRAEWVGDDGRPVPYRAGCIAVEAAWDYVARHAEITQYEYRLFMDKARARAESFRVVADDQRERAVRAEAEVAHYRQMAEDQHASIETLITEREAWRARCEEATAELARTRDAHDGEVADVGGGVVGSEAVFDELGHFLGHEPRECGEHRTVGEHRAWCFADSEWCYPTEPCRGCEIVGLRARAAGAGGPG